MEVAKHVLHQIKSSNLETPPLRAFVQINETETLRQAEASRLRHASGNPISVLDGVPFSIKEEFDVVGFSTTLGTAVYSSIANSDSTIVAKLKNLGAIVVGKTNMHEIGKRNKKKCIT